MDLRTEIHMFSLVNTAAFSVKSSDIKRTQDWYRPGTSALCPRPQPSQLGISKVQTSEETLALKTEVFNCMLVIKLESQNIT